MRKNPARLNRCNAHSILEEQLSISFIELLVIIFFVFLFFIISMLVIPQTYGFL